MSKHRRGYHGHGIDYFLRNNNYMLPIATETSYVNIKGVHGLDMPGGGDAGAYLTREDNVYIII